MAKHPKIIFCLDIYAEQENALNFISKESWYKKRFFPTGLYKSISREKDFEKQKNILNKFIAEYYRKNKNEINQGLKTIETNWKDIEKKYFDFISLIFHEHGWPKGKYVGYASIFKMFPRNIENKTFSFPYKKQKFRWSIKVIAHEMLHFIFFDYIHKIYGLSEIKGRNYVWKVSESFNCVMENWKPYREMLSLKKISKPYPGCEKIYSKMATDWVQHQDVKKLLDLMFKK
jgi:hypothetical protein